MYRVKIEQPKIESVEHDPDHLPFMYAHTASVTAGEYVGARIFTSPTGIHLLVDVRDVAQFREHYPILDGDFVIDLEPIIETFLHEVKRLTSTKTLEVKKMKTKEESGL